MITSKRDVSQGHEFLLKHRTLFPGATKFAKVQRTRFGLIGCAESTGLALSFYLHRKT
jgi:hypothetical protein